MYNIEQGHCQCKHLYQNSAQQHGAFETVGLDFVGPISYKVKKAQGKYKVPLYACAMSRAVHLDLLPDMTTEWLKEVLQNLYHEEGDQLNLLVTTQNRLWL